MKNSKEYAQRLQKLYRELKRKHPKVETTTYDDPADALISGIIREGMRESVAQKAINQIRGAFVDWNDLRVSRAEEIAEALGEDTACSRATAFALTSALKCIFDEHHKISLQYLKKLGKRPARQDLEKLEGVSRFVVNYCMLTSMQAHAIPLTTEMIEYLKRNEIIDADAHEQDIEGFLTRQVPAKNAYEFFSLLRRESESPRVARKRARARPRPARAPKARAKK